jgi:hypothetical protein
MPRPSHLPWTDHPNIWWRAKSVELLIMQFSLPSCHPIPLRSKKYHQYMPMSVTLTTHPHLVPRLSMSRSYTFFSPHVPPRCVAGQLYYMPMRWQNKAKQVLTLIATHWTVVKCV